jgi:hypothetical protein
MGQSTAPVRPKCRQYIGTPFPNGTGRFGESLRQTEEKDAIRVEDFSGSQDGSIRGQALVVDQDCAIDRSFQEGGREPREEGATIEEDQIKPASSPGHEAGPARSGEHISRRGDGRTKGEECE